MVGVSTMMLSGPIIRMNNSILYEHKIYFPWTTDTKQFPLKETNSLHILTALLIT